MKAMSPKYAALINRALKVQSTTPIVRSISFSNVPEEDGFDGWVCDVLQWDKFHNHVGTIKGVNPDVLSLKEQFTLQHEEVPGVPTYDGE